jgi:hypothetical protein
MDPPTSPVVARTTAAVVSEIQGYVQAKNIDQLFKKVLTRCFRVRPDDPIGMGLLTTN